MEFPSTEVDDVFSPPQATFGQLGVNGLVKQSRALDEELAIVQRTLEARTENAVSVLAAASQRLGVVELHRALGGGWSDDAGSAARPPRHRGGVRFPRAQTILHGAP